jgi:hypothetical protein
MQQPINLFLALARESCRLDTIHKPPLHRLGVLDFLHEARMLLHAGDIERLGFGADAIDKIIIGNSRG